MKNKVWHLALIMVVVALATTGCGALLDAMTQPSDATPLGAEVTAVVNDSLEASGMTADQIKAIGSAITAGVAKVAAGAVQSQTGLPMEVTLGIFALLQTLVSKTANKFLYGKKKDVPIG